MPSSFNIADRCPVGCQCYWRAQDRVKELSDDDVAQFFKKKRDDGYVLANLVGGEPYVRPKLLRRVAGVMPLSWLMTSATTPLIRLERTTHMVSIDGANGETHDRMRRMKGPFERIIKHLRAARAGGDFPTIIHTTLNAMNFQGIADLLRIWRDNGLADGVLVSTMTPIKGAGDDELRLSYDQRVWIVEERRGSKRYMVISSAWPSRSCKGCIPITPSC